MPSDTPGTPGTTPLTWKDRDELRRLHTRATPGQWDQNYNHHLQVVVWADEQYPRPVCTCQNRHDSEFIAAAVNALPRLLDSLDAAHDVIARALAAANAPVPPGEDPDDVCIRDLAAVINILSAPETGAGGSDHAQEGQNRTGTPQEGK